MIKTITLQSGKALNLAANAATPFRFKQLFNTDLLKVFQQNTKSEEDNWLLADTLSQLAFVMNRQAERVDMSTLSLDEFYTWLEGYEPMDFALAGEEIINTYLASTQTSIQSKKK